VVGTGLSVEVGAKHGDVAPMKATYHASGQIHVKVNDEMTAGPIRSTLPTSLLGPMMAGLIPTKAPRKFPPYAKKMPTGSSLVVQLDETAEKRRQHVEVWFTPPGTFTFPKLYAKQDRHERHPDFALTVTARLLAVGWITPMDETMSAWQPNASVWIVGPVF
jgi:hypothetical protein